MKRELAVQLNSMVGDPLVRKWDESTKHKQQQMQYVFSGRTKELALPLKKNYFFRY